MDSNTIDTALRDALAAAGMRPRYIELGVLTLKRDEAGLKTLGVERAVAAFKANNAEHFSTSYRDKSKSLEQLEQQRDKQTRDRARDFIY